MNKKKRFTDVYNNQPVEIPSSDDVYPAPIIPLPERKGVASDDLGYHAVMTATGLVIGSELSTDQWKAVGQKIREYTDKMQWVIGDWMLYAEQNYGLEILDGKVTTNVYDLAESITGYARRSLWRFKNVAEYFDGEDFLRRKSTKYSIHAIAYEELPEVARDSIINEMLANAEKEKWTATKLREEIRAIKKELGQLPERVNTSRLSDAQERFSKHLTPEQFNRMSTDEQFEFWQWWQEQTECIRQWMERD